MLPTWYTTKATNHAITKLYPRKTNANFFPASLAITATVARQEVYNSRKIINDNADAEVKLDLITFLNPESAFSVSSVFIDGLKRDKTLSFTAEPNPFTCSSMAGRK